MDLVALFNDTMERFRNDPLLREAAMQACMGTKVFPEGFISAKAPRFAQSAVDFFSGTTLQAAEMLRGEGYVPAVLNFANPIEPGGGVLRGARAQEESLCRASGLYISLTHENAVPYYAYHRMQDLSNSQPVWPFSDMCVYTQACPVIRRDVCKDGVWKTEILDTMWQMNVITCAAPCLQCDLDPEMADDHKALFVRRIINILEVAMENEEEALVLGAFGCGEFWNPPRLVADAFGAVMDMPRYKHAFRKVIFAVRPAFRGRDANTRIFREAFAAKDV